MISRRGLFKTLGSLIPAAVVVGAGGPVATIAGMKSVSSTLESSEFGVEPLPDYDHHHLILDVPNHTHMILTALPKVVLNGGLQCECGWQMYAITTHTSRSIPYTATTTCVNKECKWYDKKFQIVSLPEVQIRDI